MPESLDRQRLADWRQRMIQANDDYMAGRITIDEYYDACKSDSRRLEDVIRGVAKWRIDQRQKRQGQDG